MTFLRENTPNKCIHFSIGRISYIKYRRELICTSTTERTFNTRVNCRELNYVNIYMCLYDTRVSFEGSSSTEWEMNVWPASKVCVNSSMNKVEKDIIIHTFYTMFHVHIQTWLYMIQDKQYTNLSIYFLFLYFFNYIIL